eukprot:PITA_02655
MRNYEREASIRPPVFDGTNFNYWKVRVTAYLQSLGTKVWDIVETSYAFPSATPTDAGEKKKYETNAKAVSTLLGCISQSEFMKVMHYKSAKEIWDKIVTSYDGDEQVKRAKLQTLRIQYETLKMYNDESVANYFLRVDEVVNCMKNLGEEIKEAIVVEKVLRSLSPKFESKVSAIEEKENLRTLTMSQLHGILTAYEMRKGGPSDRREVAFKASGKGEYYEASHIPEEEEEESNFVRNLQRGSGRFREGEIVGLRKEIEKTKAINLKFVKGSETLDEIIDVQQSPLNKTGLGYNGETYQASTSKSYLDAARRSEQKNNEDHQVKQG